LTKQVGATDVDTMVDEQNQIVVACWYYELTKFSVRIMYVLPGYEISGLMNAWHPSNITHRIKIADCFKP
jgi:hypothetical protein